MFFQTKKGGGRDENVKVDFFKFGCVFLLLTLGLGLFPTETEGLECYDCLQFNSGGYPLGCVVPPNRLGTQKCAGEYCKMIYRKGDRKYFSRGCVHGSEHLNNSILFQCAEKFFGKEGEGFCLEITPENLKVVEDCHWSKVGNDLKYPGFGYSMGVLGSYQYGGKACFCKGNLCNGGPIPGIKEMEVKSSGVECYTCSSKPPVYGPNKCDFQSPDDIIHNVWCADQTHCFKRTGTQGQPWSYYPVEYIERGCSNNMVPDATVEETIKLIECLKKYGGCVSAKSEAGSECLKGLMNDTAVHPPPPAFDLTEIDELCVCEGDLCNGEASQPIDEDNEGSPVEDAKMADSFYFIRWFFRVLLITALVGFTCLITFQKVKVEILVEINCYF